MQPESETSLFPSSIHETIERILSSAGVTMHKGYTLDRYNTALTAEGGPKLQGIVCVKKEDIQVIEVEITCEVSPKD